MKRKILVPMFASVMALSMNTVANADQIENNENDKNSDRTLDLGEYQEVTYKTAVVKDGVAVKIRKSGDVQTVAYTGDEFKVIGTQDEWIKVALEDGDGWLAARYVDIKESIGYTTVEKVNFRTEANTDSEIIKELELGSTVKVLEVNESWLKVKKGEDEGYIRSLYVSDEAPVIEEEESVVVNETQVSNTQNNSNQSSSSSNNSSSSSNGQTQNSNSSSSSSNSSNSSNGQTQKPVQNNDNSYNPPASSTSSVQAVLNLAYSKIGCPYVWGAEGPNSFDCSGFTSYVFRNAAGVSLPRTSSAQSGYGMTVSKSNLQAGDLVFFNTSGKGVSHVGIYVGGGKMVHAPSSGKTVSVTSINSSYYSSRFVTAKRVL